MRWFVYVQRRDARCVRRRMLRMKPLGRRRWKTKRWFIDALREDVQAVGVTEEDVEDKVRWKVIRCGYPEQERQKEEEEEEEDDEKEKKKKKKKKKKTKMKKKKKKKKKKK